MRKLKTFINKADDKNVSLKSLNLSDVKLLIQCEVRVFIELDVAFDSCKFKHSASC